MPDGGLTQPSSPSRTMTTLDEAERAHILRPLQESDWVIGGTSGAAAKLGTKRSSLPYKMKKLEIARPVSCQSSGIESVVWRSFFGNAFPIRHSFLCCCIKNPLPPNTYPLFQVH